MRLFALAIGLDDELSGFFCLVGAQLNIRQYFVRAVEGRGTWSATYRPGGGHRIGVGTAQVAFASMGSSRCRRARNRVRA